MEDVYEKLLRCRDVVLKLSGGFSPRLALILGSGLEDLAATMDVIEQVPYREIPGFPVSTVPGHKGCYLFGTIEGVPVVCMIYTTQLTTLYKSLLFSESEVNDFLLNSAYQGSGVQDSGDLLKLAVVQLGVEAAFCQKLLMAAALDDVAVLHDEDDVRVFDRGQAVRDHEGRPPLHQFVHEGNLIWIRKKKRRV